MTDQIFSDFGPASTVMSSDIVPIQRGLIPGSQAYAYYTIAELTAYILNSVMQSLIEGDNVTLVPNEDGTTTINALPGFTFDPNTIYIVDPEAYVPVGGDFISDPQGNDIVDSDNNNLVSP